MVDAIQAKTSNESADVMQQGIAVRTAEKGSYKDFGFRLKRWHADATCR